MLIEGSKILPTNRATVWQLLNDVAFLRTTLPDCQSLTQTEDAYHAVLTSAIGPVRASFDVTFRCEVDVPMQSYTLIGQGEGGMAGSAQASIRIVLSDVDKGTLLHYTADTTIHGKIAQLGSRLIQGAVRKFSERFFLNVQTQLASEAEQYDGVQIPVTRADVHIRRADPQLSASLPDFLTPTIRWWLPIACGAGCFIGTLLAHYVARYLP